MKSTRTTQIKIIDPNPINGNKIRRSAKDIANFAKKVKIPNEKETRVVRLLKKDATYADFLSVKKLKQGIMKELAKDPVDLNEYLRIAQADVLANNENVEPEERRNVITIGDIDSEHVKLGI